MKTTIEFIKLTVVSVGTALAILLLTGIASFAQAKDIIGTKHLGISWGDTTIKGFKSDPGFKSTSVKEIKKYQKKNNITLFQLQDKVVRYGDTAFFIQAPGDECYNRAQDCNRPNGEKKKRVEVGTDYGFKGNIWLSYSFYITDDYEISDDNSMNKSILQFHSTESYFPPMFQLQIDKERGLLWRHESGGGMIVVAGGNDDCSPGAGGKDNTANRIYCEAQHDWYKLISADKLERNTWYDLVFNINFDKKDITKAYHKIWVNGELTHERHNQTLWLDQKGVKSSDNLANLKFGIYGSYKDNSYQSLYIDEVHFGRKCNKLLLDKLGYSCSDLESQQIAESKAIMTEDKVHYYTTGEVKISRN